MFSSCVFHANFVVNLLIQSFWDTRQILKLGVIAQWRKQ